MFLGNFKGLCFHQEHLEKKTNNSSNNNKKRTSSQQQEVKISREYKRSARRISDVGQGASREEKRDTKEEQEF